MIRRHALIAGRRKSRQGRRYVVLLVYRDLERVGALSSALERGEHVVSRLRKVMVVERKRGRFELDNVVNAGIGNYEELLKNL